jgi:hypothetical protein
MCLRVWIIGMRFRSAPQFFVVFSVCDRERDRELWDGRASVKVVCCWEKVPKMVFFPYQVRGRFNCLSLYLS